MAWESPEEVGTVPGLLEVVDRLCWPCLYCYNLYYISIFQATLGWISKYVGSERLDGLLVIGRWYITFLQTNYPLEGKLLLAVWVMQGSTIIRIFTDVLKTIV